MEDNRNTGAAFILGIMLIASAYLLSNTLHKAQHSDRYVTVKGLAEREVDADLAIWPIEFSVTTNDLQLMHKKLSQKKDIVKDFLIASGFVEKEISLSTPTIVDTETAYYREKKTEFRYIGEMVINVRSNKVNLVKTTRAKTIELLSKGIVLSGKGYSSRVEYIFTSLNKIKPAMIKEATQNARKAAEEFAKDSDSKVGKLKHAHQGFFSISDLDSNSPDRKKIRVVTTLKYYLN